jgi:streptogramin lyase
VNNGCSLSPGERVRVRGKHTQKFSCAFLFCALVLSLNAQDSVTTLAGRELISGAANGTGTNAAFSDPAAMVADKSGNFFVADSQNHAIRKITAGGAVTTFAGQLGVAGSANGIGAQFNTPSGLAFDQGGNLFVSDTGNNLIRKITPAGAVSTFAGVAGAGGFLDGAADGALFNSPLGITVASNGIIYVADSGNHCIRKISGGVISTFAGSPQVWGSVDAKGTNAQFNGPVGLAFDNRMNLFVCDANNDTIRKIAPDGTVTTFAGAAGLDGAADGDVSSARFRSPAELAFDRKGNLFVADSLNQTVREIATNGIVSTVCGAAGVYGSDDGINGAGRFFNPYGLVVTAEGSLQVADTYNELVRTVLVPFKLSLLISGTGTLATISWDAVIGKKYQIQFKNDLAAAWANLGESVTATDLSLSATDNSGAGPQRFYRVLVTP